jgi:hypothetical protein
LHFNLRKAKAAGYKATFTDWLISLRSNRVHSEFLFSERYCDLSFSSTMKSGENGPRFKRIIYSHPEYWDRQVIPMTDDEENKAYRFAEFLEKMEFRYDLFGLLSFATPLEIITPVRWRMWCSECVASLIQEAFPDFNGSPDELTPDGLYIEIGKRWKYGGTVNKL